MPVPVMTAAALTMSVASWTHRIVTAIAEGRSTLTPYPAFAKSRPASGDIAQEFPLRIAELQRARLALEDERDRLQQGIQGLEAAQKAGRRIPGVDTEETLRLKRERLAAVGRGLDLVTTERRALAAVRQILDDAEAAGLTLGKGLDLDNPSRLEAQLLELRTETQMVERDAEEWSNVMQSLAATPGGA